MTRPASTRQDSDPDRTIGALLRVGTVQSVDLEAGKVIVAMGDQTTPPIDWLMPVGDTTLWIPPTVGQQVLVLAPEGDIEQAMVLNGLPSSAFAPLFLGLVNTIRFKDGAQVSYDPEAERLEVNTPGSVSITAPGGVTIVGDANLSGHVAADASALYARNLVNFLTLMVDTEHRLLEPDRDDEILKATLVCRDGRIVNPVLAQKEAS